MRARRHLSDLIYMLGKSEVHYANDIGIVKSV